MKKTFSFALIHFTIAFLVAYALTGDIIIGSLIAMIEPTVNTGAFYIHEKVWSSLERLRTLDKNAHIKTASFAVVHFSVAFGVVYLLTGSALTGGLVAVLEPCLNSIAYFFHEKHWNKKNATCPNGICA